MSRPRRVPLWVILDVLTLRRRNRRALHARIAPYLRPVNAAVAEHRSLTLDEAIDRLSRTR